MSVETADWCVTEGNLTISGTRMVERSRKTEGVHWCFRCRTRAEFERIVMSPDGISYYGPSVSIDCTNCGARDGDLFPGWTRDWDDS